MESFKIVIPVVVALISGIFGQPIVHLITSYQRRRLKKIINASEAHSLFDKYGGDDFKSNFILPDLKETYFYIQTGIATNEKSIEKYIDFKNELGGNYTWYQIKTAKPHLNLDEEKIDIKLNKFQRVFKNAVLTTSTILFIVAFLGFMSLAQSKTGKPIEVIIISLSLIVTMVFGYAMVNGISSILIASQMEKVLTKKLNED